MPHPVPPRRLRFMTRDLRIGRMLAIALLPVAAVAAAGCEELSNSRLDFTATEKVAITEIQVSGGSGSVTIRGDGQAGQVRINRIVRYQRDEPGKTYRLAGTVLHIETDCGNRCSVDYDIQAPAGVAVRGENGSGDMDLDDVAAVDVRVGSGSISVTDGSAEVSVRTGSGEITVDGATGGLNATAGSGSIDARRVAGGPVRLKTGSGEVALVMTKPGSVSAEASSGEVTVTVPPGRYRVRADTGSGNLDVRVPDDPAGEHLLELETGSGDITAATTATG